MSPRDFQFLGVAIRVCEGGINCRHVSVRGIKCLWAWPYGVLKVSGPCMRPLASARCDGLLYTSYFIINLLTYF